MKKVSQIIIPFLFIFCGVACCDLMLFSSSNNSGDLELILSNPAQGAFHHNHSEEPEISHEDFFRQSDLSYLYEIRISPEKSTHNIISSLLKNTCDFWHPPKLT